MKIIGEASAGKLLIEASRDEITNLFGVHSAYSLKDIDMKSDDIRPGLEINVKGSYERLHWLNKKHQERTFDEVRKACERLMAETEKLPAVFKVIRGDDAE